MSCLCYENSLGGGGGMEGGMVERDESISSFVLWKGFIGTPERARDVERDESIICLCCGNTVVGLGQRERERLREIKVSHSFLFWEMFGTHGRERWKHESRSFIVWLVDM